MSAAKHTPGPWGLATVPTCIGTCHKIGPFPSLGSRTETHACVYAENVREGDYGHSKVGDELLANARLIAAAPDLLDAARATIAAVEDQIGTGWSDEQIYDMTSVALSEAYFKARAAIAKATGQQPDPTR